MSWTTQDDIQKLQQGISIILCPPGDSMRPLVRPNEECMISPLGENDPQEGDIVFCRVRGRPYVHLIKAIQGDRYQIGNNKGGVNGWVGRGAIFGKMTRNGGGPDA